jgi:amino acid transporter
MKRLLVGRAMASHRLEHTLLPKILALPVFASDPLSSVAYATEESMAVLLAASAGTKHLITPISVAIASLLAVVVISYRQTIRAYPNGGGAYIVSRENLGELPGLIAASALLVDYMMTVVVSVVAGVYAITSAAPTLQQHRVLLCIGFVGFVTFANLRGTRESGTLFAIPTYGFVLAILTMIGIGLVRCATGCPATEAVQPAPHVVAVVAPISLWIVLKAFSSGATALTGVEAISNGVQAFRRPQARNAATTLLMMGVMSIAMYLGISWLAVHIPGTTVSEDRTVVAQIAHAVFGGGFGFYVVQFFTAAILILAANTAYQDFPRLASILARDHYMPRQFVNRGDRLVFSNGIVGLALISALVIYAFDANLTRLIQLYIVGVFTAFTLSQTGMIRHWLAEKRKVEGGQRGWRRSIVINVVGAVVTGVVLVVVTATKFVGGAWLSISAMGLLVPVLYGIKRHYFAVQAELRRGRVTPGQTGENHVVILVQRLDAATAEALGYVKSIRPSSVTAIHPAPDAVIPPALRERWRRLAGDAMPLVPIPSGNLLHAVRAHVRTIERTPDDFVTVIVPEVVRERLFSYVLHRRSLIRLKAGLLREPGVVVTDAPVVEMEDIGDAGAEPLIPGRSVTLVFVSAVHDASIRAVNYALSLGAPETRAVTFQLDPEDAGGIEVGWFDQRVGIPLDVVEAPFRDLTGPMLDEVRRYTIRGDTVVTVVLPELLVTKWRHFLLHNQNALFVKRLMLYEPRVVLSSVPSVLSESHGARAAAMEP